MSMYQCKQCGYTLCRCVMTPDDSARGTVERVAQIQRQRAMGMDIGQTPIDELLAHITTLEAQREEAQADVERYLTEIERGADIKITLRRELAQARREAEGYRGDAVILGAELKSAQAGLDRLSHKAEAAKERAHDAEEKVRMLEHVSVSNPPEDKVDGRVFRLTDDMVKQQRERADRLAEALRRIEMGEEGVPGLRPQFYGHASQIAHEALGHGADTYLHCPIFRALLTPPSPATVSGDRAIADAYAVHHAHYHAECNIAGPPSPPSPADKKPSHVCAFDFLPDGSLGCEKCEPPSSPEKETT